MYLFLFVSSTFMKKFLRFLSVWSVVVGLFFTWLTFAEDFQHWDQQEKIVYPAWSEFVQLRALLDEYFVDTQYRYIPNFKYNVLIEKQIKALVIESFVGNEAFYAQLFFSHADWTEGDPIDLKQILQRIPSAKQALPTLQNFFSKDIFSSRLLAASFDVSYRPQKTQDAMLSSIWQVIQQWKIEHDVCPSIEDLKSETIYHNNQEVTIENVWDDIVYTNRYQTDLSGSEQEKVIQETIEKFLLINKQNRIGVLWDKEMIVIQQFVEVLKKSPKRAEAIIKTTHIRAEDAWPGLEWAILSQIASLMSQIKRAVAWENICSVTRKEKNFSYEEALEKIAEMPRNTFMGSQQRAQQLADQAGFQQVDQALLLYNSDHATYPDTLDELSWTYLGSLPIQSEDLVYRISTDKQSYTLEFSEEYITEHDKKNTSLFEAKDYVTLLGDTPVPAIPDIYKHIPKDSIFLHVKNPTFLFNILHDEQGLWNMSMQSLKKLKNLIQQWLDIDDFVAIEKNIHHGFVIVLSDVDLTKPHITIILDKQDAGLVEHTRMATKDMGNYIYLSPSSFLLNEFVQWDEQESIYHADDFRYLRSKKSKKFQDIFFYAGDSFFEKIVSFDFYVRMRRKLVAYMDLYDLQHYIWWYKMLFQRDIWRDDLENFFAVLDVDKDEVMKTYTIDEHSILTHKDIGSLDKLKNVSEIAYDLDSISREEMQWYQKSVLKYRDTRRANFDPVWVFINESAEGTIEVDFFMTPIPHGIGSWWLQILGDIPNRWLSSLDFMMDDDLRIGNIWFILGYDVKKVKEYVASNNEIHYEQLLDREEKYLWGEKLEDFFGGEILLGIGDIHSDSWEERNVDLLDAFVALEFTSQKKIKEFISLQRARIQQLSKESADQGMGSRAQDFLTKPIVSSYRGHKIYYVPTQKLLMKMGIYYVMLDRYVYITVNEATVKKIIDYAQDNINKKHTFQAQMDEQGKFLTFFVDTVALQTMMKPRKPADVMKGIFGWFPFLRDKYLAYIYQDIAQFYHDVAYARLWQTSIPDYTLNIWFLTLESKGDTLYLQLEDPWFSSKDKEAKKSLDEIFSQIDPVYFSKNGEDITLLWQGKERTLTALLTWAFVDEVLADHSSNPLLSNMLLSFMVGNDEIGVRLVTSAGDVSEKKKKSWWINILGQEERKWLFLLLVLFFGIIIIATMIFVHAKKNIKEKDVSSSLGWN